MVLLGKAADFLGTVWGLIPGQENVRQEEGEGGGERAPGMEEKEERRRKSGRTGGKEKGVWSAEERQRAQTLGSQVAERGQRPWALGHLLVQTG